MANTPACGHAICAAACGHPLCGWVGEGTCQLRDDADIPQVLRKVMAANVDPRILLDHLESDVDNPLLHDRQREDTRKLLEAFGSKREDVRTLLAALAAKRE